MAAVGSSIDRHNLRSLLFETEEIKNLKRLSKSRNLHLALLHGRNACVKPVMEALKECSWAHFCCHGSQDAQNPLKSYLCLYDADLTVRDMAGAQLPHAEFAFLSACHTASSSADFEDEAFHIAGGVQFAGFRSVIGTLWSISDRHVSDATTLVYEHLFQLGVAYPGEPDPTQAAFAVGEAMRRFREHNVPLHIWTPFIHIGV